jgi:outer membrane lipoprotein carrier protein
MRLVLSVLALALVVPGVAVPPRLLAQPAPPAADLAARLQKRYESIRDFTADFTQTYRGVLLRQAATERGKLLLKKPSRIRFTYESPERKLFVSDGTVFRTYYPEERSGSISPLPKDDEASTALLFLAGRGDLSRDFTPSIATGAPAGEWRLGLVPKSKQADFETLTLFLDARTLALLGFVTTDDQGTNTIRFSNLKENAGLSDRAFEFTFPKGTEISR